MAKLVVGGITYSIPDMNFIALERAWPYIETAMAAPDLMTGVKAGIHMCAAGMMEMTDFSLEAFDITEDMIQQITFGVTERDDAIFQLVAKTIMRRLRAAEIGSVRDAINEIMTEAGLVAEPGEAPAGVKMIPLPMETSVDTSQNSLPLDLREAAGTQSENPGDSNDIAS